MSVSPARECWLASCWPTPHASGGRTVILNRPDSPPLIQGVLLPEGRELQPFSLLDHHNEAFTNEDLKGRWHLVSYGFTTCPDICPTTLSQLAGVAAQLEQHGGADLRFLFYTVDHRRDTVSQMATYMPFFHPDFVGLTHLDDSNNPHLPFEQEPGIVAQAGADHGARRRAGTPMTTRSITAPPCSCSTRRASYRRFWKRMRTNRVTRHLTGRKSCETTWQYADIWDNWSSISRAAER